MTLARSRGGALQAVDEEDVGVLEVGVLGEAALEERDGLGAEAAETAVERWR